MFTCLPIDLVHLILDFDGRIMYRKGQYVDRIHKYDPRYDIVKPIISKKQTIMKTIQLDGSSFYFEFAFDIDNRVGLCYDYHFSYQHAFEICYYDTRDGLQQIRTHL